MKHENHCKSDRGFLPRLSDIWPCFLHLGVLGHVGLQLLLQVGHVGGVIHQDDLLQEVLRRPDIRICVILLQICRDAIQEKSQNNEVCMTTRMMLTSVLLCHKGTQSPSVTFIALSLSCCLHGIRELTSRKSLHGVDRGPIWCRMSL